MTTNERHHDLDDLFLPPTPAEREEQALKDAACAAALGMTVDEMDSWHADQYLRDNYPERYKDDPPIPAALVIVVTGGRDVSVFTTGHPADVADVAAEALAMRTPAGLILAAVAEAVVPRPPGGLIATARALASLKWCGCDAASSCESLGCWDCLTLRNLVEIAEPKEGSCGPYPLTDTRTPLPEFGRQW